MNSYIQHVYIIGSKGIPAKYGGFETFVEKLTEFQQSSKIQYHVACMSENSKKSGFTTKQFEYNGAMCFNIDVPNIGPAKAVYYDVLALKYAINMAKKNSDKNPIFYVLACRIGPFIRVLKREIKKLNGKLFVNPDGHEWLRAKWSYPVRKYWKYSEQLMVKYSDFLICDSENIEKYIKEEYKRYNPHTTYIAYGTDIKKAKLDATDKDVREWFNKNKIEENEYYLVVGRFVPENNYETIIREFIESDTKRDLVLITNVEKNKYFDLLKDKTRFYEDERIKFVGTLYNEELLKYIREKAFAYIHGHEVGGTNPSLLEALAFTKLNFLFNIGFNKEVAQNGAIYWGKEVGNLAHNINYYDKVNPDTALQLYRMNMNRVISNFSWELIESKYSSIFKGDINDKYN